MSEKDEQQQAEPINVSALPAVARQPVQEVASLLLELARENLKGFTVFGGVLATDFDPKWMRIQSAAVLGRIDLAMLNELRPKGLKLGKLGIQAPLIMTPDYIEASCDAFPIDLLEIQQLHATVFGCDYFQDLQFARPDVRLQCERELKRALIQLRQGLLAAAHQDKVLRHLCLAAAEHATRVLRAILWLKDHKVPPSIRGTVDAVRPVVQMELAGLKAALLPELPPDFSRFEAVYHDVESLSRWVDKLQV